MKTDEFLCSLEEALGVPAGTIKLEASLKDLGCWDSIAALTFMALADQKLQVSISGSHIQRCRSVHDLVNLLGDKINL